MHKYTRRPLQAKAFGKDLILSNNQVSFIASVFMFPHKSAMFIWHGSVLKFVAKKVAQNSVSIVSAVSLVVLVSSGGI